MASSPSPSPATMQMPVPQVPRYNGDDQAQSTRARPNLDVPTPQMHQRQFPMGMPEPHIPMSPSPAPYVPASVDPRSHPEPESGHRVSASMTMPTPSVAHGRLSTPTPVLVVSPEPEFSQTVPASIPMPVPTVPSNPPPPPMPSPMAQTDSFLRPPTANSYRYQAGAPQGSTALGSTGDSGIATSMLRSRPPTPMAMPEPVVEAHLPEPPPPPPSLGPPVQEFLAMPSAHDSTPINIASPLAPPMSMPELVVLDDGGASAAAAAAAAAAVASTAIPEVDAPQPPPTTDTGLNPDGTAQTQGFPESSMPNAAYMPHPYPYWSYPGFPYYAPPPPYGPGYGQPITNDYQTWAQGWRNKKEVENAAKAFAEYERRKEKRKHRGAVQAEIEREEEEFERMEKLAREEGKLDAQMQAETESEAEELAYQAGRNQAERDRMIWDQQVRASLFPPGWGRYHGAGGGWAAGPPPTLAPFVPASGSPRSRSGPSPAFHGSHVATPCGIPEYMWSWDMLLRATQPSRVDWIGSWDHVPFVQRGPFKKSRFPFFGRKTHPRRS